MIGKSLFFTVCTVLLSGGVAAADLPELLAPPPSLGIGAPSTRGPNAPSGLQIDAQDPYDVARAYQDVLVPALDNPFEWSGSAELCEPGVVATRYSQGSINAVNFFRAMAGLPGDVKLDSELSLEAQAAALIMVSNEQLSHDPPPDWTCWSTLGAEGASHSNIGLGSRAGAHGILSFVRDNGSNNGPVGHRRWILSPRQQAMGVGNAMSATARYRFGYALQVFGTFGARPSLPEFVAWPPHGYVPEDLIYPRWSFSPNDSPSEVDLSGATVSVRIDDTPVTVVVEALISGYGDDTLVWIVDHDFVGTEPGTAVDVTIKGALVGGVSRDYSYTVFPFDPANPFNPTLIGQLRNGLKRLLGQEPETAPVDLNSDNLFDCADLLGGFGG